MMLIHGKIKNFELVSDKDIKFTLVGNIAHEYLFENNKIYFLVVDLQDYNRIDKKITLCDNVSNTKFSFESNKLKTEVSWEERTYKNNFSIITQN